MKKSELKQLIKEEISKQLLPKLEVGQIWFYPFPWYGKENTIQRYIK